VKRAVRERDQGKCTFVSETGQRCCSRRGLEYDHVIPVARGGEATIENIRLLCRAHNQYEAECTLGAGFMSQKREQAQRANEARKQAAAEKEHARARAAEAQECLRAAQEQAKDLTAGLQGLGFRSAEIRRAVDYCASIPETTLEARVRAALTFLRPKARVTSAEARV